MAELGAPPKRLLKWALYKNLPKEWMLSLGALATLNCLPSPDITLQETGFCVGHFWLLQCLQSSVIAFKIIVKRQSSFRNWRRARVSKLSN